jgi:hypothetical protein
MKNGDVDEGERLRGLLHGARGVGTAIPVLAQAATALLDAGEALESIALDLSKIGSDTARAISDTVAMKQYLATVAEREVGMRRDFDAIKARMAARERDLRWEMGAIKARLPKRPEKKPKTNKPKRRKGKLK